MHDVVQWEGGRRTSSPPGIRKMALSACRSRTGDVVPVLLCPFNCARFMMCLPVGLYSAHRAARPLTRPWDGPQWGQAAAALGPHYGSGRAKSVLMPVRKAAFARRWLARPSSTENICKTGFDIRICEPNVDCELSFKKDIGEPNLNGHSAN